MTKLIVTFRNFANVPKISLFIGPKIFKLTLLLSSLQSLTLNLSDPTSDLVRQYDFLVLLRYRKMSDTVVVFVRPLSEHVRRFSSCSTDFSQQIAQVVLSLFLHFF
jgi:hypothetical protein